MSDSFPILLITFTYDGGIPWLQIKNLGFTKDMKLKPTWGDTTTNRA